MDAGPGGGQPAEIDPSAAPDAFSKTESFEDLRASIDSEVEREGKIRGTVQEYTADDLRQIIDGVRSGTYAIETVTRTKGLRQKVHQLLAEERAAVSASLSAETARYSAARLALGMEPSPEPSTPAIAELRNREAALSRVDQTMASIAAEEAPPIESPERGSASGVEPVAVERAQNATLREALTAAAEKGIAGKVYSLNGNEIYDEAIVFGRGEPAEGSEKTVRLYRGVTRLDRYGAASLFGQVSSAMRTTGDDGRTHVLEEVRPYVEKLADEPTYENLREYAEKISPLLKREEERNFLKMGMARIEEGLTEGYDLKTLLMHEQFGFNGGTSHHWLAPYVSTSAKTKYPTGYGEDAVMVLDVPLSKVEFFEEVGDEETFVKGDIDQKYVTAVLSPKKTHVKSEDADRHRDQRMRELEAAAAAIDSIAPTNRATAEEVRQLEESRQSESYLESKKAAAGRDAEAVWARRVGEIATRLDRHVPVKDMVEKMREAGSKEAEVFRTVAEHVFDRLDERLLVIGRHIENMEKREGGRYTNQPFDRSKLDTKTLLDLMGQTEHLEDLYEDQKRRRAAEPR